MNFEKLQKELKESTDVIFDNPRYRSDKRRNRRLVDTWKMICQSYESKCIDTYEVCLLYGVMGQVNYHLYPLTKDEAMRYIDFVISNIA